MNASEWNSKQIARVSSNLFKINAIKLSTRARFTGYLSNIHQLLTHAA
jgi:hypothetical protein